MDITSYLLGKNAGGGTSNLQDKEVTITENTTTTVTPDAGYDGLSSVEVTTNVSAVTYFPPVYSATEILIGTWIDNKPLYMKTITDTQTTDNSGFFENDLATGVTNIDTIFLGKDSYMLNESTSQSYDPNYYNVTSGNVISWNLCYPKTDGKIYNKSTGIFPANTTIKCVYNIFYTKTTDAAVQDVSTIQGRHYSQTEHEVGQDIQGNTIYEKTMEVYTSSIGNNYPVNKNVAHNIANVKDIWLGDGSFVKVTSVNQRMPANYLNHNASTYRQVIHTTANKTHLSVFVGDWIFPGGKVYNYATLRYTKTA